ncbi:hypothetical protein [Streptosporangium amethystogenes]|uniref:hypothetical protein n=1 Tax=Streptosporangium amethystogenes TaxID=2002 RepID=UPI00068E429D|nr:hypothetical protein [Streptosporangium amethystogenes]
MNSRFNPDNDRLVHKTDKDDLNAPRHTEGVAPEFQEPHHGDASRITPDADMRDPLTDDQDDVITGEPVGDRRGVPADLDDGEPPRDPAATPGTPVTGTGAHDTVPATGSPVTPGLPGSAAGQQGDVLDEDAALVDAERTDRAPATAETLFGHDSDDVLRRWQEVQAGFVDDPRDAVQRADSLLDEVTSSFRNALEARATELQGRWKNTERNDTEDLRTALRDYRTTLEQLLNISAGTR